MNILAYVLLMIMPSLYSPVGSGDHQPVRQVVTVASTPDLAPALFISSTSIYRDRIEIQTARGVVILKRVVISREGVITGRDQAGQAWELRIVKN